MNGNDQSVFGNLERNLQTQKGKQIDSKESQWQVVSL